MNCKRCHRETSVAKTFKSVGFVTRERRCECGITFFTTEKIIAKSTRSSTGVYRRAITPEMKTLVLEKCRSICIYCGTGEKLGVDHVIPVSAPIREGWDVETETNYRNSIENMVACCQPCNFAKGDSLTWKGRKGYELAAAPVAQKNEEKGEDIDSDLSLFPDSSGPSRQSDQDQTRERVRGKSREYSGAFEHCWKQYGRKEEKDRAFAQWIVEARQLGGEENLESLILKALIWQAPLFAADGWKFAKYFERYLKAHKWNDQPPPRKGDGARMAAPYHAPLKPALTAPAPWTAEQREEATRLRQVRERAPSDDTLTPPDWMGLDEKLAAAKGTG